MVNKNGTAPVHLNPQCSSLMLQPGVMNTPQAYLCSAAAQTVNTAPRNPHELQKVTWAVISAGNGEILNSTTHEAIAGAQWPKLYFDLCDLVRGSWDIGDWTPAHEGVHRDSVPRFSIFLPKPNISVPTHPGCGKTPEPLEKSRQLRDPSLVPSRLPFD
ncbi:hypothetical protein A6R68_11172 [Neotoma lepida]|uniref:Uncharacterized protein n=1 Tax=Neotoma lepida TaxID=56216 RepID=A0A1A6FUS4_NEOLE|nr:hypothetical protein A6R68_11172 [Neotoma lepida]